MNIPHYNLKAILKAARNCDCAVGAFNIFNELSAYSAVQAAEEAQVPIILQTSVGTVRQLTPQRLIGFLNMLKVSATVPVIVHLDHCTDVDLAKHCADIGWDAVMIDMSKKSFDENVRITQDVRKHASLRGVCVEGELGIISGVEEHVESASATATSFEDAMRYLELTDIDLFAPSIGTAHGVYKGEVHLDFELVRKLSAATNTPIVVHGGTGLSSADFSQLISCGASKINVSTALKYGYVDGLKAFLAQDTDHYNPLAVDAFTQSSISTVVAEHIRYFRSKQYHV